MPCTYYSPQEERDMAYAEAKRQKDELDKATRLLCSVMGRLEHVYGTVQNKADFQAVVREVRLTLVDPELAAWWTAHKAMDAARLAAEEAERKAKEERDRKIAKTKRLRKAGLAKLTAEEREALGIKAPGRKRRGKF